MTTPLPMTQVAFSLRTPEGRRWNLYFLPSTTMVWPALDPPATRAQTSYSFEGDVLCVCRCVRGDGCECYDMRKINCIKCKHNESNIMVDNF